jgi:hypothetical protein
MLRKIREHLKANRTAYIMTAVAISAIALQQLNRTQFDKFLVSKGIDPDEYYCPEYYYEKKLKAYQP